MFSKRVRKIITLLTSVSMLTMATPKVWAASSTSYYDCKEGDCCDCSSVIMKVFDKTMEGNRFDPTRASYSFSEFNDDLREGLYNSVDANSTEYDLELSKFEAITLMDKYLSPTMVSSGKTIKYPVKQSNGTWKEETKPWTKRNAMEAYWFTYTKEAEETSVENGKSMARNVWNNDIVPYLDFSSIATTRPNNINYDEYLNIFKNVGLDELDATKSIADNKKHLGHTHKSGSSSGLFEECYCSHCCSVIRRAEIQSCVIDDRLDGVDDLKGYDYYFEANVTATNPLLVGLVPSKMKIGVINIGTTTAPYFIVAECVCRLGVELAPIENPTPIVTPSPASTSVEIDGSNNFIQPEGLTNVNAEIEINDNIKNLEVNINLKAMFDDKLPVDGTDEQIMKYIFYDNAASITDSKDRILPVIKVTETTSGSTVDVSDCKIGLYSSTPSDGFYGGESPAGFDFENFTPTGLKIKFKDGETYSSGTKFEIKMLIPTQIGDKIKYSHSSEGYIEKRVNDPAKQKIEVNAVYSGEVKLFDAYDVTDEDGITTHYDEVYGSYTSDESDNVINLQYVELAKIN